MKIKSPIINRIAVVTGLFLGAFALAALADWSAPQHTPPTCPSGESGCDAPLNVGSISQSKQGPLLINTDGSLTYGLDVWGIARFNGGIDIETRTTQQGDPSNPDTGRMWLIQ